MSKFTRPGKNLSKKSASRRRRHIRVRKKITGTTLKPRLVVTRSLRNVSVQVIDDLTGKTLAYASSIEEGVAGDKTAQAKVVGKKVAERATAAGLTVPAGDLIVAGCAWEHGVEIEHHDAHLTALAKLCE